MSSGGGVAAVAAAVAARKRKEKERHEEEVLTKYNNDDINGWEFKIVRSLMGRFGNSEYIRRVCEEEARAGWEMLEKFDDHRIRFKRRVDKRSMDQHGDINPYRSEVGIGQGGIALAVILGAALLIGGILLMGYLKGGL